MGPLLYIRQTLKPQDGDGHTRTLPVIPTLLYIELNVTLGSVKHLECLMLSE